MVVGVGIGGTFEKAATLAKKATFRSIDTHNSDKRYADLEDELLESINKMGFGPAGLGGTTTAIGVNIETYPTHIAGMPVAVNICCHAARHAHTII
jgi:fumarate hydratase subunit alpha